MKNNSNKRISTISIVLIVQLVVLLILSLIITTTVSSSTKKNSIDHMATITDERAQIIESYVKDAEETLTYYSQAAQIYNLLKAPNDPDAVAAAQQYTEEFSANVDNLEGIYASEWNTHVLTHTNPKTVGITTRTEKDSLDALHQALAIAGRGVYDAGIIISPASGEQVVSMYKAVYDENNKAIGLVGLGIYTEGLISTLDSLPIRGIDNSFYSMINVNDNKYIFNDDKDLIGQEVTSDELLELCDDYRDQKESDSGNFEYKSDGKKYISIYSYMPEHGWILMLDDTTKEVFSLTTSMRIYLGIFFVALIILIFIFNYITRAQNKMNEKLTTAINKTNKTKESLYTTMFKDVLTDVNNRISFSMDVEKIKPDENAPFYFAMFSIKNLSNVNTKYGNDIGDWALVKTADTINQSFRNTKVYRTGSGEFVVAVQTKSTTGAQQEIFKNVADTLEKLKATHSTPSGKLTFEYSAAVIKKNKDLDASIITSLKDCSKSPDPTGQLPFNYKNLD